MSELLCVACSHYKMDHYGWVGVGAKPKTMRSGCHIDGCYCTGFTRSLPRWVSAVERADAVNRWITTGRHGLPPKGETP